MTKEFNFKPGSLVTLRNRPWVVMPSEDKELLLLKPLGGGDEETTGIFLPVAGENDIPASYNFIKPSANDLGDFSSARLLYNAARLSFRNAAGPFRCLGKLSFSPRAYQMVPLIMALRQDTTRLLIADDVGVGKTIEALLIARELYERKEIKRFAIVCLPHLCDQWQDELKSKFGIEAVIIRSGTVSALERQIRSNENIFRQFPFQIVSIDYIKTGNKRQVFIDHCPELILVDEAHSCTRPTGGGKGDNQRFGLLNEISKKSGQHLVLLTATPHSGKKEEFQSLLSLLKPEFASLDVTEADDAARKKLAGHFIQRRRSDILKDWEKGKERMFPERQSLEVAYEVGSVYGDLFNEILEYAREIVSDANRYSYWDALALLRGVISSPAAGAAMLRNKARKKEKEEVFNSEEAYLPLQPEQHPYLKDLIRQGFRLEAPPMFMNRESDLNVVLEISDQAESYSDYLYFGENSRELSSSEKNLLGKLADRLEAIRPDEDQKALAAIKTVRGYLKDGYSPIVFCRYIQTAKYLGEAFRKTFSKSVMIEVVTGEMEDELRKEKITAFKDLPGEKILIATDCLSEGINLQDGFNALLHYDLPWNPNRLEQREGRIDRFGQETEKVKVALLYSSNNPMDGVVLDVLLRKAIEIKQAIGISVPFPEDSASVMEAVSKAVFLKSTRVKQSPGQLTIFDDHRIETEKGKVIKALEEAAKKEKERRSIFAQASIRAGDIQTDLDEINEAIGDEKTPEKFVLQALGFLGVQMQQYKAGYRLFTSNLPQRIKNLIPQKDELLISFDSPTPQGFMFIGRNHPFTEQLCHMILNEALQGGSHRAARSAVLRSSAVAIKTVLFQFRVRNVIADLQENRQVVAEEMWLWGYEGEVSQRQFIGKEKALSLLMNLQPTQNMEEAEKVWWLKEETEWIRDENSFRSLTDAVALERADHLVASHTRFKKHVGGNTYKVVEPVLPMDVLGVYILLPEAK